MALDIGHRTRPTVTFQLAYVNTSVYTVRLSEVRGSVSYGGSTLAGHFDFGPVSVSHGDVLYVNLPFVLSAQASVKALQDHIDLGKALNLDLRAVTLVAEAVENEDTIAPILIRLEEIFFHPPAHAVVREAEPKRERWITHRGLCWEDAGEDEAAVDGPFCPTHLVLLRTMTYPAGTQRADMDDLVGKGQFIHMCIADGEKFAVESDFMMTLRDVAEEAEELLNGMRRREL